MDVIGSEVKKRRDSITQFRAAQRHELADKEEQELAVLMVYLPAQLTEDELVPLLRMRLCAQAHQARRRWGRCLGFYRKELKGRADMALVAQIVKKKILG